MGLDKMSDFAVRTEPLFLRFCRNYRQNGEGTVEEIGFEEFLVVMSHFRPPSMHMTDEQRENVRREKLRCVSENKSHGHMFTCFPLSVAHEQLLNCVLCFSLQFYSTCMTQTMMGQ